MSQQTFLPEDYLAKKAERRTNFLSLVLFVVVMGSVFSAFLVTNRQWTDLKAEQDRINVEYVRAAEDIRNLTALEQQREEMLNKAELAAALVERVPRSILLAELINRMPPQLGLLEFELKSQLIPPARQRAERNDTRRNRSARLSSRERAQTLEEADESLNRIQPPRYRVSLVMVGIAPTDLEVSRYLAELNAYRLLRDVSLEYSEQREFEGRTMRQFRISMHLAPDADVRHVEPLQVPRGLRNPMTDELHLPPHGFDPSAAVNPNQGRN